MNFEQDANELNPEQLNKVAGGTGTDEGLSKYNCVGCGKKIPLSAISHPSPDGSLLGLDYVCPYCGIDVRGGAPYLP